MYPHERSLVKELANEPFALIGVNSDSKQRALDALARENISWRSFFNGGSTSGPISQAWGVRSWPTIYIVDDRGIIRHKNVRGEAMTEAVKELIERSITKLLEQIKNDDPEVRSLAAFRLGRYDGPDAARLLKPLVKDEEPLVRRRAATGLALVTRPDKSFYPMLLEASTDPDSEVRIASLQCLARAKHPQTLAVARKALDESLNEVRRAAIASLGELGDSAAVPLLKESIADKDRVLAVNAIDALVDLGSEPAVNALKELAGVSDHPARVELAVALHNAGEPGSAERFGRLLADDQPDVRRNMTKSLATLQEFDATDLMIKALADDDLMVSKTAHDFLSTSSLPRAKEALRLFVVNRVEKLLPKIVGNDFNARRMAAQQLMQLGPDAAPLLLDKMAVLQGSAQLQVAQIIGYSGNEMVFDKVAKRLGDPELNPQQRYAHESIVRYFAYRSRDKARAAALQLVEQTEPVVRVSGVKLLGMFRDADAVKKLEPLLSDSTPAVQWNAAFVLSTSRNEEALQVLTEAITKADAANISIVASGLSNYGEQVAVPLLIKLGDQGSAQHKASAISSLGRFKGEEATKAIVAIAGDDAARRNMAVYALSRQGSAAAADALAEYLKGANETMTTQIIAGLKRMRSARANEILKAHEEAKKEKD